MRAPSRFHAPRTTERSETGAFSAPGVLGAGLRVWLKDLDATAGRTK